jgi:flagellar hook-associated protein 2
MSNIISSLGGGSGIDTTSLVSQLTQIERAPKEQRLDARQEKLEAEISAYGTLKSALSDFQGVLSPLSNSDTFNARSVAFPETSVITPNSLAAGAQTGSYQIEVMGVAKAQSLVMGNNADPKSPLGATGELSIQFGEWNYSGSDPDQFQVNDGRAALNITVDASDSLQTLADKINKGDSGAQASVMKVDGQYQLLLSAPSGASNAMQVTASDGSVGLEGFEYSQASAVAGTGALQTQAASDAVLKINGLEVRRDTNTIDDVIEGFDFTVNKASEGEVVSFSVDADKGVAEQSIRDFVEAYNSFLTTAKNLTGYSKDEDNNTVRGDLATDGTAKSLVSRLRSMVGSEVSSIESGFTALTNLGIRTELDGSLSINEKEFSSAMTNNFDLVGDLFAQKASSTNSFVDVGMGTRIGNTVPGNYQVEITQDPAKGSLTGGSVGALFDSALDTSGGGYSFKISVDGTTSNEITLSGVYSDAESLRSELQSLINGDEKLKGVNATIDVGFDTDTGQFTFTSREYGSRSEVALSAQTAAMDDLGLGTGSTLTATEGQDVQGTINGIAAFGAGNVLLPELGSDAYGLNLSIRPGATAEGEFTIGFSRGMGGQLTNLIDQFLARDGAIASREDNIDKQLDRVSTDREDLDRRMEKYESRISAQFLAMERIISSLNSTGSSLDGILDRLPFTAQK